MNVKNETGPLGQIRNILQKRNGILLTADLARVGISRTYLSALELRGEIERGARGVYQSTDAMTDEMINLVADVFLKHPSLALPEFLRNSGRECFG